MAARNPEQGRPEIAPSDRSRDGESPAGERGAAPSAAPAMASRRVTAEEQEMIAGGVVEMDPESDVDRSAARAASEARRRSFWCFGEPVASSGGRRPSDGNWREE